MGCLNSKDATEGLIEPDTKGLMVPEEGAEVHVVPEPKKAVEPKKLTPENRKEVIKVFCIADEKGATVTREPGQIVNKAAECVHADSPSQRLRAPMSTDEHRCRAAVQCQWPSRAAACPASAPRWRAGELPSRRHPPRVALALTDRRAAACSQVRARGRL